ncbi:hypothetical protein DPMN_014729 [Dreissena polymorpha]|uniref:Uncharacterized protein n=1 Tax=Dreissena polymorpha TaxID=45954 RepID=A0A9D4NBI0_DREPO|nr:hypothetical protein DPMN_014729 [Dreissena polymorpha]
MKIGQKCDFYCKNAPPTAGHAFSQIPTIFKLPNRENCHYIHKEKNAPPTGGHVFFTDLDHFRTRPRHQLNQWKTAPPTGGHVFQRIGTTFELNQDIIKTNILTNDLLLTKFHEDGTRNVASRTDGHTTNKDRSQKLT